MWSDRYYYLNIAHDLNLSAGHPTSGLISFLRNQKELCQESDFRFRNSTIFHSFVDIQLLKAKSYSIWSDKDTDSDYTNLVAIVCAKGGDSKFDEIKELLIAIAAFLQWELIDEETDDGQENFVLWAPPSAGK